MPAPRLLVTGFGPFPGAADNPSARLARRLGTDSRLRRLGIAAHVRLLPTDYRAVDALVKTIVTETEPAAVLMFGVAGRRRHLSLERRAINRWSILHPDAAGWRPARLAFAPSPAGARLSGVLVAQLAVLSRQPELAVRPSRDAGTYLCNFAYYRMMAALPATTPCLFVHIPRVRSRAMMNRLVAAGVALARALMRRDRLVRAGRGS